MKAPALRFARAVFLAGATLSMAAANAYELYNKGPTKLLFNVDVVGAGFADPGSWFGESEAFLGGDTDSWLEFGVEPKISFETALGQGTLFGQVSGVYTQTFGNDASGLTIGLEDPGEATLEQGHLGWRAEDLFAGLEEDTFSMTFGRQDYLIGTGLLIADGGGDGGERGGWYIGMRKAFQESVVVSLKSKELRAEGFRLENNPRRGGTEGEAYGGNFEYTFAGAATLGVTYIGVEANIPGTDRLDVFSGRANWNLANGLGFGGEYVHETNDQIDADGWYAQISYEPPGMPWAPVFSYRYAAFDGDDPNTPEDERFREIAYGYTDYGYWFQGEITGNYPLGNNNLISSMVRAKAKPREDLTLNAIYYHFTLDEPQALAPQVTDDDWGDEINFMADWAATSQIYVIGVLGALFPGEGAEQYVGGDETWLYSMLYGSYSW